MSAGAKMKQGGVARDWCSRSGQGRFPCLAWPTWNQPGDAVRERCFQQREQPVQRPQQIPCDGCLSPGLHHLLHQTFHFFHLPLSWLLPSSYVHGNLCKASPHYSHLFLPRYLHFPASLLGCLSPCSHDWLLCNILLGHWESELERYLEGLFWEKKHQFLSHIYTLDVKTRIIKICNFR